MSVWNFWSTCFLYILCMRMWIYLCTYWMCMWMCAFVVFMGSYWLCSCCIHPDHVEGKTPKHWCCLKCSSSCCILRQSLVQTVRYGFISSDLGAKPCYRGRSRVAANCRPEEAGGSVCLLRTAHSKSQRVICSFCHLINGPGAKDKPLGSS